MHPADPVGEYEAEDVTILMSFRFLALAHVQDIPCVICMLTGQRQQNLPMSFMCVLHSDVRDDGL